MKAEEKSSQAGRRTGAVNIRDVAKEAGVSVTTVSHSLNGIGRVDPDTRARVTEIARELGYRANPSARHMRSGKSGIVAVINSVPPGMPYGVVDLEFLVVAMMAAAESALSDGYFPTLLPPLPDPDALDRIPLDGAILFDPVAGDTTLRHLREAAVPTVTIGRDPTEDDGWWVDNDFESLTGAMLDHLAAGGAERILLLTAHSEQSYMDDQRAAYLSWVARHGHEPLVCEMEPPFTVEGGFTTVRELLARPDRPDAIYVVLEQMAAPTLEAIADAGLRVPDDIAVAVASDSSFARSARVPLTSLDLDPSAIGAGAMELLAERMAAATAPHGRLIDARLVVRDSTRV